MQLYAQADPLCIEGVAAQLHFKAQFQDRGLWGEGWRPHWTPMWWVSIKETARNDHRHEAAELHRIGAPPFGPRRQERHGNPPWTGHERAFVVALDAMPGQLAEMPFPPTQANRRRLAELAAFVAAKRLEWGERETV